MAVSLVAGVDVVVIQHFADAGVKPVSIIYSIEIILTEKNTGFREKPIPLSV